MVEVRPAGLAGYGLAASMLADPFTRRRARPVRKAAPQVSDTAKPILEFIPALPVEEPARAVSRLDAPPEAGRLHDVRRAPSGRPHAVLVLNGEIGRGQEIQWWKISAWLREKSATLGAHLQLRFETCEGGSIQDSELACSSIRTAAEKNLITISAYARHWVASAAIDLFIAADHRTAHPGAKFKLHRSRYRHEPANLSSAEIQYLIECDDRSAAFLAERTGSPKHQWLALMSAETVLDASQALALGLAYEIARAHG